MKSLRMLCNLGWVAIFLLCASLPCFADSSQLNLNLSGQLGFVGLDSGSGAFHGTLPDGSEWFVDFGAGPPTSVEATSGCRDLSDPDTQCITANTYGGGGSITIDFENQIFTGLILGGSGELDLGNLPFFQRVSATFTLTGYNGVGTVSVSEGIPMFQSASLSFTGTATPEPGGFLLLFSGAGILAGLIGRRMWA